MGLQQDWRDVCLGMNDLMTHIASVAREFVHVMC